MLKKLLAFLAAMSLSAAFAVVDINKASEADLDGIKGVGPATSRLIVTERKKSEFKNWADFIARVKGVGEKNAAKFSTEGMTVGGVPYQAATKIDAKTSKKEEKAMTIKPAASTASAAKN
ncbi:ComEA family DNA-binding protein [Polaromonas hydrogenivorans]|uniref:Helix-hairpin-helix domain-containing protein n=1 Tax=Polaromonas hydrogenivorans TaxID=335476 RepID=A0AAU7LV19_9BURK